MRLPIEDLWPNAESTPVHKPALPAALAPDNDGNVGGSLGGDVKARRVLRQVAVEVPGKTRMSLNSKIAVMRPHICCVL